MRRSNTFKLHRRLPFVTCLGPQSKQTGSGVEQATKTAGWRAIQATFEHGGQQLAIASGKAFYQKGRNLGTAPAGMEGAGCHSPRLAGGTITTGQQQGRKMTESEALRTINPQQFTAPQTAIRPQPDAVNRQTEHRLVELMFGADCSDMGLVVTDRNRRNLPLGGKAQSKPG